MEAGLELYSDPMVYIPLSAMFLIIFAIVFRTMGDVPLFEGGDSRVVRGVVSVCVSVLAMFGMDRVIIRPILWSYAAMGYAMLSGLAALLLVTWISMIIESRKKQ